MLISRSIVVFLLLGLLGCSNKQEITMPTYTVPALSGEAIVSMGTDGGFKPPTK